MVRIKICGLTNLDDYRYAQKLAVEYTGFIFYSKSPRFVEADQAKRIVASGLDLRNLRVGVFVNEKIEVIRKVFHSVPLDIVQLHGDESPEYCQKLALPCWKAIRVREETSLRDMERYPCEAFLLDTFSPNAYGGTGRSFDISIAKKAIAKKKNIIIAGGISGKNITEVLAVSPFAVDINSAIESTPGNKDHEKMNSIVTKIRNIKQEQ